MSSNFQVKSELEKNVLSYVQNSLSWSLVDCLQEERSDFVDHRSRVQPITAQ